jgi:hypothetical protein
VIFTYDRRFGIWSILYTKLNILVFWELKFRFSVIRSDGFIKTFSLIVNLIIFFNLRSLPSVNIFPVCILMDNMIMRLFRMP